MITRSVCCLNFGCSDFISGVEHVFICFEDNGIGMNSKTKKSMFKPFYSTKSFVQNWGIGLSYVEKIVKMHSGNISIKSAKNKGTSFYVLLPLI